MGGPDRLAGTRWRLERIGDAAVSESVQSTIAFGDDGRVSGSAGVNRFSGGYRVAGGTVELGDLMHTLMAGPEDAMEQERRFLEAVRGARPYAIEGDVLTIGDARFRRVDRHVVSGRVT